MIMQANDQNTWTVATSGELLVRSVDDADLLMERVVTAARTVSWVMAHNGRPLDLLRSNKFDAIGFRPVEGRALNLIEQVNQTWTYVPSVPRHDEASPVREWRRSGLVRRHLIG
ncbi:MAG: hypothetical protein K0R27_746 [Xanthobacteraceae bacterium]|jgi:hypothetical protein|nr:hypothetical protein [Xanthobacteraceae bacterium]